MRAAIAILLLVLGGCGDGPSRSEDIARRRIEASYPGGLVSLVTHKLASDEVVVCGYARSRGAPSPNAFVWRRGHLMSPTEVSAIPSDQLTTLCGPDYTPPIEVTPPS